MVNRFFSNGDEEANTTANMDDHPAIKESAVNQNLSGPIEIFYPPLVQSGFVESIQDILLCRWQADTTLTYVNQAYCDFFGKSYQDLVGQPYLSLLPDETTQQEVLSFVQDLVTNQEARSYQHKVQDTQGNIRYFHWVDQPIMNASGELLEFQSIGIDVTEQFHQLNALRASEAKFCQVFETSPFGIGVADPLNYRFIDVNRALCAMLGYTAAELLQTTILDIIPPEEREQERLQLQTEIAQQTHRDVSEKRYLTRTHDIIWANLKTTTLRDSSGKIQFWVGMIEDITERRSAENALNQRTAELQALLNAFPDVLFWTDANGIILNYHTASDESFDAEVSNFLGKSVQEVLPPPVGERIHQAIQATLACQSLVSIEYALPTSTGNQYYETRLLPFQNNQVIATTRNITHHKQTEEALRRSEEGYRALVSNLPGAVYRGKNDRDWTFLFVSEGIQDITGYPPAALINNAHLSFASLIPEDEQMQVYRAIQDALKNRQPFQLEYRCRTANGDYRWVLDRGQGYWDSQGNLCYLNGVLLDITDLKQTEAQLAYRTSHDVLTGLPNRTLFFKHLARALEHSQIDRQYQFAVLVLDVDQFKIINDSLGHGIGDQLLVEMATRLQTCFRPGDFVARLGGDEFAVHLEDISGVSDVTLVADRIAQMMQQPFLLKGLHITASVSTGITLQLENSVVMYVQAQEMLRDAEIAMYRAKEAGRSQFALYDIGMHTYAVERLHLETELRLACQEQNFVLHYQPIIDLTSQKLAGFEALVRWQHLEQGMIFPDRFIPLAEETGLVMTIDDIVLMQACCQLKRWQQQFPQQPSLFMCVNLSARHFNREDLVSHVAQTLKFSGLAPRHLKLEITETALIENTDVALTKLQALRNLGVQISLDDFGTGYSSLSYIHRFPLDTLKIDRSFTQALHHQLASRQIVQAIVALAKSLRLRVVAEGIENRDHLAYLQGISCEYGQGYFFAKPLQQEEAEALVRAA